MSQASVFAGPTSGGMHLANAFERPSVIIIGGYEGPKGYDYPMTTFYTAVPCAPCWLGKECPHELRCHMAIEPAQVAAAVREKLSTALHS